MNVIPTKDFDKSVKKLKDKVARERLYELIADLEDAKNLKEISNVVPMTNYPFTYRITRGDFRLLVEYLMDGENIMLHEYVRRNEKTYKKYR